MGRPGAQASWERRLGALARGGEAHHGGQCDALVPLRIGRLLQDLAGRAEDTEDR